MKDINARDYKLGRFIDLCFRIASWVDERAEAGDTLALTEFGLGHLAMSGCLRDGICSVVQLEKDYRCAINRERVARELEKDARNFLEDIFGDCSIDDINDVDKERIREFVSKIEAEWDEED